MALSNITLENGGMDCHLEQENTKDVMVIYTKESLEMD